MCRYTLNIDSHRHEDVLLHMKMLQEAREVDSRSNYCGGGDDDDSIVVPLVHVRKVQLMGLCGGSDTDGLTDIDRRLPRPTFGSTSNLAGLGIGNSPKEPRSRSTPPHLHGLFINPLHMDDHEGVVTPSDDPTFGFEVTVATTDKMGLLKDLASAISDLHPNLNIQVSTPTLHAITIE